MNAGIWYRIDKGTGEIAVSNGVNVVRAASGSFKKPNHAIATGRFMTPFAIYSSGDKLTPEENAALERQESKPLTADQKDGGARFEAAQNAGLDY